MEPEGSLPYSQEHTTSLYPKQAQSTPNPTTYHFKIHLNIIHPSTPGVPSGLFPTGFLTKPLYTPLPSPFELHAPPISLFSIISPATYWVRSADHGAPHYEVFSTPLQRHKYRHNFHSRLEQCVTPGCYTRDVICKACFNVIRNNMFIIKSVIPRILLYFWRMYNLCVHTIGHNL
jgi:hypothetical protein